MTTKKVLFIIDTIQGAGAERSLMEIAGNFKRYTPVFVHLYPGDMLKKEMEKKGIKVYSLDIQKRYGFNEACKLLTTIYKNEKPNLIHSTLFRADLVARRMKTKFPHIPLIGSFVNNTYTPDRYRNVSWFMKLKLWLVYQMDRRTAKKVDFFISNSETIKKAEGGALKVPQSKVEVIYRGRDFSKFKSIEESKLLHIESELGIKRENMLLNVSRLIPRKAQLDIINALPKVLEEFPETVLVIAGHGVYKSILEERARKLNIQDHVKLLGRRSDVAELLELAKLFIYPSYAEGLPGALIEAMMAQKVIIASNIGENLECVNEESALIFPRGEVEKLANKIIYALKNFEHVKGLGRTARVIAKEKFNILNIADRYEEVYDEILVSKGLKK
jgi:glycosyltransferase involved in cell wall biosynthesis